MIGDEFESREENPTNLPDFIKRDLRWCQGNLQYLRLLAMPGLRPMGRFQLVNAIMMYAGAPMSFLLLAVSLAVAASPHPLALGAPIAFGLYLTMMALGFAPRLIGVADILLRGDARRYGGTGRMLAGSLLDTLFSLLIGPVMMVAQMLSPLAGGLLETALGWRAIFSVIAAAALATVVAIGLLLPETRGERASADGFRGDVFSLLSSRACRRQRNMT